MLVKELIAELEQLDPNAEVLVASQDHYPYAERCVMRECHAAVSAFW
jgi:hypothetical protein